MRTSFIIAYQRWCFIRKSFFPGICGSGEANRDFRLRLSKYKWTQIHGFEISISGNDKTWFVRLNNNTFNCFVPKGQATRFVQKFHEERRSKLGAVLDSERWRQAEITPDIQSNVDTFFGSPSDVTAPFKSHPVSETISVRGESYVVVGAALFFLPQLLEYCNCVDNLPTAAPDLLTRLVELLKTFNSRTCQLVLGAGALPLVGLKTISSRNLALASRSLQLIALFIPLLKAHFEERLAPKQKTMIKHFDQALKVLIFHYDIYYAL